LIVEEGAVKFLERPGFIIIKNDDGGNSIKITIKTRE